MVVVVRVRVLVLLVVADLRLLIVAITILTVASGGQRSRLIHLGLELRDQLRPAHPGPVELIKRIIIIWTGGSLDVI